MTFQILIDEIENNLNKILEELGISDVNFSVEPAKKVLVMFSNNLHFYLQNNSKKPKKYLKLSEKYQNFSELHCFKSEPHPSGYLNFFANNLKN